MLHEKLSAPVEATVKWDGTNVGRCCDGTMVGRRRVIPNEKLDYQKASLNELKAADAEGVKDSLLKSIGAEPRCKLYIYGELMCNQLYDYTALGLDDSWLPFGAILHIQEPYPGAISMGHGVSERLKELGFLNQMANVPEEGTVSVKLLNCPVLRECFEAHGLNPPAPLFDFGSHYDLVETMYHWMLGEQGEGLVISPATVANQLGDHLPAKWKCPSEPQFGNIKALEELDKLLLESQLDSILPSQIPQLLRRLMAVATGGAISVSKECPEEDQLVRSLSAELVKLQRETSQDELERASSGGSTGDNPPTRWVLEPLALWEAILSAATKFDAVAAYRSAGALGEIRALLNVEVVQDLGLDGKGKSADALAVEGEGTRCRGREEVAAAVDLFLGQQA